MFSNNSYAMVWAVEPAQSGNYTKVRLSTNGKDKDGNIAQDFGDFCMFVGKANESARKLKEKDRIKILNCGVKNTYNRETKRNFYNFIVFDFEMSNGSGNSKSTQSSPKRPSFEVESTEIDDTPF